MSQTIHGFNIRKKEGKNLFIQSIDAKSHKPGRTAHEKKKKKNHSIIHDAILNMGFFLFSVIVAHVLCAHCTLYTTGGPVEDL